MTESQIRSVAIFFYYSLPHELLAMEATEKALAKISKQRIQDSKELEIFIVSTCNEIASQLIHKIEKAKENLETRSFAEKYSRLSEGIVKQSQLQLGPWRQFVRDIGHEELFLLIWVHILDFDKNCVAIASKLTTGTLQYRVSGLIRKLGFCLTPGSGNKINQGQLDVQN